MVRDRLAAAGLFCFAVAGLQAQSLWQPSFNGYIAGNSAVAVNDTIFVTIDTSTKLSYTASSVSDHSMTLELGGGGADVLSFLPPATASSTTNLKGGEELALSTTLATRVESVEPNGLLDIEGSRTTAVNGKQETLSLTGVVDPRLLHDNRTVSFTQVVDAKLSYTSFIEPEAQVLTSADLVAALRQLAAQPAAPAAPPVAPAAAPAASQGTPAAQPGPAANPTAQQPEYTLSDAKKKALLLQYLNQLLDLLFQPVAPQ